MFEMRAGAFLGSQCPTKARIYSSNPSNDGRLLFKVGGRCLMIVGTESETVLPCSLTPQSSFAAPLLWRIAEGKV